MSCKTVGPWRFVRFLLIKMSPSDFCTKWYANISIYKYIYHVLNNEKYMLHTYRFIFIMRLINIQIYINQHFRSCPNTVIVFDYFPTDAGLNRQAPNIPKWCCFQGDAFQNFSRWHLRMTHRKKTHPQHPHSHRIHVWYICLHLT